MVRRLKNGGQRLVARYPSNQLSGVSFGFGPNAIQSFSQLPSVSSFRQLIDLLYPFARFVIENASVLPAKKNTGRQPSTSHGEVDDRIGTRVGQRCIDRSSSRPRHDKTFP